MRLDIVTAVLIAFAPTLSSACASYAFCHCTEPGSRAPNDAATKASCGRFGGDYRLVKGVWECSAGSANAGIGGVVNLFISNCKMREECNKHGAMGDSWCWAKA